MFYLNTSANIVYFRTVDLVDNNFESKNKILADKLLSTSKARK
jgi:hypothetical protein